MKYLMNDMRRKHKKNCKCTRCKIIKGLSIGKTALHYKHGKTSNNRCIDCDKKISFQSQRCKSCGQKYRNKDKIKHWFCACGKEISRYAKQCQECYWTIVLKNRVTGKNNFNYIDGKSREPYPLEFNNSLKEEIRKRDNYKCQKCNIFEEEYIIVYGIVLCIHHIDYNKDNNHKNNLVTLCRECNVRVNHNRYYWQSYFENKIIIRSEIKL